MNQKTKKNRDSFSNSEETIAKSPWEDCRIGITGANGSLGEALTKCLRAKGAFIIGLTHSPINNKSMAKNGPNEWVSWQCGQENLLEETLEELDILILNHGFNPKGIQNSNALNEAIEINALSTWRLIERFEGIIKKDKNSSKSREIWINTSEAEIQPALSPGYEISKRLIGQLVSLRWNNLNNELRKKLKIRKLILGPFNSKLNPIGIMSAEFVANQVIRQIELGLSLIIVTPNPITYIAIPLNELIRSFYSFLTRKIFASE